MSDTLPDFRAFGKIPRWSRKAIITEKIDGTNGCIYISDDLTQVIAGSRNRWLTPESDNAGFARWVQEHAPDLLKLGAGYHYGEWWGPGIGRSYGQREKRFSLFNTSRWSDPMIRPACCYVVPVLWTGPMDQIRTGIEDSIGILVNQGSLASPGFMRPEGIVIFHEYGRVLFKKTLENDDEPKSRS